MTEPSLNDTMEAHAADAVDYAATCHHIELDFSPNSIDAIEKIAGRLHDDLPRGFLGKIFNRGPSDFEFNTICKILGGYVGEVIRRERGGNWGHHEGIIALQLGPDLWIFPVQKVFKRLKNGPEDNVASFYRVVTDSLAPSPKDGQ